MSRADAFTRSELMAVLVSHFDIHTFDLMNLSHAFSALSTVNVSIALIRVELIDCLVPLARSLSAGGHPIAHTFGVQDGTWHSAEPILSGVGLCGVINLGASPSSISRHLLTVVDTCPQHPPESAFSERRDKVASSIAVDRLDAVDLSILSLLAIGARDEEIAQSLHFSNQTIRNRVSIMLHVLDSKNRTELALAWHRYTIASELREPFQDR
jgi:DNA-binding CsgD family transcriptional regulator